MKHFLSAFSDDDASRIVANCKEVLAPGGSILLLQVKIGGVGGWGEVGGLKVEVS